MRTLVAVSLLLCALAPAAAPQDPAPAEAPTFKVFLLAGQSNMEGQAVVDLDDERDYNGGRGTLARLLDDPRAAERVAHLRDHEGRFTTRDDVFCWYQPERGPLKAGPLSVGFAVYPGRHHFGPELQFGHVVGDELAEPVLLIKTAWGGKSLHTDFRPPSAGGETGPYWTRMLGEYRDGLAAARERFPELRGRRPVLAGFVWFQGWNDMFDEASVTGYADDLVHLAADVRQALGVPDLPVVVGETGNADNEVFRAAQRRGAERIPAPSAFVPTRAFLRAAEDSPNQGHGHHWFGNAESYFLIGDALGRAMVGLLEQR